MSPASSPDALLPVSNPAALLLVHSLADLLLVSGLVLQPSDSGLGFQSCSLPPAQSLEVFSPLCSHPERLGSCHRILGHPSDLFSLLVRPPGCPPLLFSTTVLALHLYFPVSSLLQLHAICLLSPALPLSGPRICEPKNTITVSLLHYY